MTRRRRNRSMDRISGRTRSVLLVKALEARAVYPQMLPYADELSSRAHVIGRQSDVEFS